jgi:hypothetical protein
MTPATTRWGEILTTGLWLSIDCSFIEPQHMVVMKNFLPRFNYDKSKVQGY